MAITVSTRELNNGFPKFSGLREEIRITDRYYIQGTLASDNAQNPVLARAFAGVPQYGDVHPDYALAKVVERNIVNFGPMSSQATITYSDNVTYNMELDGAAVTTYDMSGRTETQPWGLDEIDTVNHIYAAIGSDNEGAQVFRPALSITFEHLESNVDTVIYDLTGRVNAAAYKGFAARTLLFVGAVARSEGGSWRVTYSFLYSSIAHVAIWRHYIDREVEEDGG